MLPIKAVGGFDDGNKSGFGTLAGINQ